MRLGILGQVSDTLSVQERTEIGHSVLGEQINVFTIVVTVIIIAGGVLLIRYAIKERRSQKSSNEN